MTELFAASMASYAQQSVQTELAAMPEDFSFNKLPTEDWILLGKAMLGQDDFDDFDDFEEEEDIFCDPEVEDDCPKVCDPDDSATECEPVCICPANEKGKIPKWCDLCPNPKKLDDTLPRWLRIVAQIMGAVFEFHVVFLAILPWWGLGIGLILADLIFDYFWYLIFFAFCKPCAYVFVWLFNIATIPLHVPYWYQRLQLELIGFIFDGWTLFFGGDGCFLRWGQDCWFAKKMKDRNHLNYTDLVWLAITQPPSTVPLGANGNLYDTSSEAVHLLDATGLTKLTSYSAFKEKMYNIKADDVARRLARKQAQQASAGQNIVLAEGPGDFIHELTERVGMFNQKFLDDLHSVFDF